VDKKIFEIFPRVIKKLMESKEDEKIKLLIPIL